jgi:thymidylate synthase (FAD)
VELKIPLLDHGFCRLVSFTQPASRHFVDSFTENDFNWSGDLEVIRNARTSFNADWRTGQDAGKDRNLIERLLLSQHTSPFEAVHFTFEVMAPIFVFRQWHRHRTWAYSEQSARYSELPEIFYVPETSVIGGQHATDKQMRQDEALNEPLAMQMQALMRAQNESAFRTYRQLIAWGMARELSRTVLPFATYSRMFGTVNLGNLIKFLMLRIDKHAQYEIRVYADAMRTLVQPICPQTIKTFDTSFKVQQMVQECLEKARKLANEEKYELDATNVFDAMREELCLE